MSANDVTPSALRREPLVPLPAEVVLGKIRDLHATREDLRACLNRNGLDSYCGTPDNILAEELLTFLEAKRRSVRATAHWHGWRVREL